MRLVIVQVLWFLFLVEAENVKRSPLQVGLVTITERPYYVENVTRAVEVVHGAHTHKWVPGRVNHHLYIPAHLHHLYVHTSQPALLVAGTAETVFVHPGACSPYRDHPGGFGVGLDTGGQGAGHGFHVVFNF